MVLDPRSLADGIRTQVGFLVDRAQAAREESATLVELRDALLPRLMSGEIRVREAEELVGDVL